MCWSLIKNEFPYLAPASSNALSRTRGLALRGSSSSSKTLDEVGVKSRRRLPDFSALARREGLSLEGLAFTTRPPALNSCWETLRTLTGSPLIEMVAETVGGVASCFALFSFLDLTSIAGVGRNCGDVVADWLRNELFAELSAETGVLLARIAKCTPMSVSQVRKACHNTCLRFPLC